MKSGKFNVVTDGQFGSTGKGLVSSYLTMEYEPEILSSTNMSNAGHTAVFTNGDKFISKILPTGAVLKKWCGDSHTIFIGPTAGFTIEQLQKEMDECQISHGNLIIHPRAGVITNKHKEMEAGGGGTKHLASTMQGCGAMIAEKVMRGQDVALARDYPALDQYIERHNWSANIMDRLNAGQTMLHDGSQGFSLDINHGHSYPFCTSRQTTATQYIADMGLPADVMGDIYLVIRPYPIRVGNVVEDGNTVGYSGDWYDDQEELTWKQVAESCGAPESIADGERTTVTGRIRRVATFSEKQLKQAILVNGCDHIVLNFANYVDWKCYGASRRHELTDKVYNFIDKINKIAKSVRENARVVLVGTGPQVNHVVDLRS